MPHPRQAWTRLASQRLFGNIVGGAITRLIGAVLLEANDKWQLQHRYMQLEAMAELTPSMHASEPDQIPPLAA